MSMKLIASHVAGVTLGVVGAGLTVIAINKIISRRHDAHLY